MRNVIRNARFSREPVRLATSGSPMSLADEPVDADDEALNIIDPAPEDGQQIDRMAGLQGYAHTLSDTDSDGMFVGSQPGILPEVRSSDEMSAHQEPALTEAMYASFKLRYADELEDQRNEEFKRAYDDGYAAGQSDGLAQYNGDLEKLGQLVASVTASMSHTLDAMADSAVEVVLESTSRILGQALAKPVGVEAVVREVIRQCKDRSRLVIRVSPKDMEMLTNACSKLTDGLNAGQVDIVGDDLVENGGCVLETPSGTLDGRLDIQLQYLRDALEAARTKWHGAGA